jgi:cysteine desulfurase
MNKKIYLDYASTTPVDPIVIKTMLPYFNKKFANTMSFHQMGAQAFETVEKARELVADAINAKKDEIIFTSSATESNNMALKGIANSYKRKGNHIIISAIEHPSIFNTAKTLEKEGFEISILTVDKNGIIDPKVLESNIKKNTILVSIIHANNEIGTIQNIKILGGICKTNDVFFHVDASQSFTKIPIDVKKENIDLLTASSHKIYGPKGAGLLYLKEGILLKPLLEGGGHERNLRSSTLNVPAIVGFAKATEIGVKLMKKENKRLLGY